MIGDNRSAAQAADALHQMHMILTGGDSKPRDACHDGVKESCRNDIDGTASGAPQANIEPNKANGEHRCYSLFTPR